MRILEHKPRFHERVFPIQSHSVEENHALWIHKHLHVFKRKDVIAGPRLGRKLELITEAGAAAAQNAKPQAARDAFAVERLANFLDGFGSDEDLLCGLLLRFRRAKLSQLSHINVRLRLPVWQRRCSTAFSCNRRWPP